MPPDPWSELLASLPETPLDACLRRHALQKPDHIALIDRGLRFTYAALDDRVSRLAGGLRAAGLRPGGTLLAFPERTWALPVLFLATVRAGGVFAPLPAHVEPDKLAPVLARGVDLAFVPDGHDALAERLHRALGDPARVLRSRSLEALDGDPLPPSTDPHAVCYVNFTSGSTGLPKGAPTTHANVQWNTRGCLERYPFTADEVYLCLFAPFAHPHEHWARTVAVGATAVMVDTLRPRTVLRAVVEHGVTWLFAIPSVFELLLRHIGDGPFESALRMCESGGAVVVPDLVRRAEAALGCPFMPIWGCTESTGVVLHVPPWEPDRRVEMLGKPVNHYAVRVDDPDPVTGVGELCVRGPAVVEGYADRPEATAEKFVDGWYRTGDLVQQEDDGYLRFLGRQEEMIKVGGVKVYLLEVERFIGRLPGVAEVAVVPATDPLRGEVPRAVIVRVPGAPLTREQVIGACRDQLPPPMVPRRVEFWDELPRGPSGKLDKRAVESRVTHPVALAVNSMLIADRPLEEAFRLAAALRGTVKGVPVFLDLRSRRDAATDPGGVWAVAHTNSDFDLGAPADVQRALALAERFEVPIAATSAYLGACQPEDLDYGEHIIDQAYELAAAAPDRTLVLRVLGGDLWARARSLPGRWQDVRQRLRDESLAAILRWEAHTRMRAEQTGRKVLLGLEVHHGQYLSGLHDIHHCCRGLREVGWDFLGFIEDPANRFIASEGDLLGAMEFARMVQAWGGRILAYHLKDVRYVSPWSQFFPQPLQRVGDRVFVWGMHKYEWTPLGQGEVDLDAAVMAAQTLSSPPHPWCLVSAEYVAASGTEAEALAVLEAYGALVRDGRV